MRIYGFLLGSSCEANQCTCSNGIAAVGSECPANGNAKCASCSTGFSLVDSVCHENQCTCDHGVAAQESIALKMVRRNVHHALVATPNLAVFGKENQCTCADGTGASGSDCPTNGEPKCASCSSGHVLVGASCQGTTAHAQMVWALLAPIALSMVKANALRAEVVMHWQVTLVRRFSAVLPMEHHQVVQIALQQRRA